MTSAAPIRYCRMCGKPEHGTLACHTAPPGGGAGTIIMRVGGVFDAESRFAEVRRRMITDCYSAADIRRWWCRVCTWSWWDGKPENHEPTCPLRLKE